jgi:hypothetical protein
MHTVDLCISSGDLSFIFEFRLRWRINNVRAYVVLLAYGEICRMQILKTGDSYLAYVGVALGDVVYPDFADAGVSRNGLVQQMRQVGLRRQ